MKPSVFISSTFYDLKYVREDLANFIRSRDFDPILFEDGDVWYIPGKKLESSCYDAMKQSDMAILIIGGNFGTESTEFTKAEEKKAEEFISITQREFKTAVENDITVFVFIDSKVANEYDIYLENENKFIDNPHYISFKATNDIRVFKFIQYVYSLKTVSVTYFSKVSEIKEFLSKQWSDIFKQFLTDQKQNEEIDTIKKSIGQLENVVAKLEIMMDAVAKNVLNEKSNEYVDTKKKQRALEICEQLDDNIGVFSLSESDTSKRSEDLISALVDISNDLVDNQLKESDYIPEDIDFLDPEDYIIIKSLDKYNFGLVKLSIDFFDIIKQINSELKNSDIKKEIKRLLDEKFYDKIVL